MPPPPHTGLSEAEAAQRLKAEGPNELPRGRRRTLGRIVLEAARDPMSQFLLAGVAIYLLLGDVHCGIWPAPGPWCCEAASACAFPDARWCGAICC